MKTTFAKCSRNRLNQNYGYTLLLKDGQDVIPEYTIGLITSTPTREKKNAGTVWAQVSENHLICTVITFDRLWEQFCLPMPVWPCRRNSSYKEVQVKRVLSPCEIQLPSCWKRSWNPSWLGNEKVWNFVITTVFVDTRLWKTKHSRKRFQNFRPSYVLLTDRIEIHQSQSLAWLFKLHYVTLAGCDWWISIRHVDNT